jgi:hypothetical protein
VCFAGKHGTPVPANPSLVALGRRITALVACRKAARPASSTCCSGSWVSESGAMRSTAGPVASASLVSLRGEAEPASQPAAAFLLDGAIRDNTKRPCAPFTVLQLATESEQAPPCLSTRPEWRPIGHTSGGLRPVASSRGARGA